MTWDAEVYRKARDATAEAAKHADAVADEHGWTLGGALWEDEASDRLYDRKDDLGPAAYLLARELVDEEARRRLERLR